MISLALPRNICLSRMGFPGPAQFNHDSFSKVIIGLVLMLLEQNMDSVSGKEWLHDYYTGNICHIAKFEIYAFIYYFVVHGMACTQEL